VVSDCDVDTTMDSMRSTTMKHSLSKRSASEKAIMITRPIGSLLQKGSSKNLLKRGTSKNVLVKEPAVVVHNQRRRSLVELDNRVFFSPKHKDHKERKSDASLDSILTDPVTDRAFHNFLMNEFSEEKLNFWRDCNNFCVVPPNERLRIACSIWDRYLSHDSQMKVTIDSSTLKEIAAAIDKAKSDNTVLKKQLFYFSQEKIFQELKFEYMPRFLLSKYFDKLQSAKHKVTFDQIEEINSSETLIDSDVAEETQNNERMKFKREVLMNAAMVQYFESYMNFRHAQNLVDFWLEVNDFQTHNDRDYQKQRFRVIMERYVQDNPERVVSVQHSLQIPLPLAMKRGLEELGHDVRISCPIEFSNVFKEAQECVYEKMLTEFYPGFLTSSYYPRNNDQWSSAGKEHHIKSIEALETFSEQRHLAETKDKFQRLTTMVSFDDAIKKPAVLRVFRNYTRATFCDENLRFYFDVDKFQKHEGLTDADKENRIDELIETYIVDSAPLLVNLDSETHEMLINAVNLEEKTAAIDHAKIEIHHLIDADSFKRFLNSNLFKEHLRLENEKLKAKFYRVS